MTAATVAWRAPDIPDLELVRVIGRGMYGEVWLGRNKVTGHLRAVKVVPLRSVDGANRAGREITALIKYESRTDTWRESLLPIYHVGQTSDVLYYVMELADDISGQPASLDPAYRPASLAARLEAGPLPPEDCLRLAREILNGLACLHDAGLVHRDVKPANLLFINGKLKLADFGLLTKTDRATSMLGTPRYMPPDMCMDAKADVYAVGLVIYEMFTGLPAGRFPHLGSAAIEAHDNTTLAKLNMLSLRASQTDRAKRFVDARAMLDALNATETTSRAIAKRLIWPIGILVPIIAALAVLAMIWWVSPTPRHADVNFITKPFEAEIYLDGSRAVDALGNPYTTPCTIPQLPARVHEVEFRHRGLPTLKAGKVDFSVNRDVIVKWDTASKMVSSQPNELPK